ncbi:MAG: hypothetical protein DRP63_09225 [Planctomycetota bacterium]|nr:MAG: hypothetical protein DRP63_09225 [Planctomycetota bacterium]
MAHNKGLTLIEVVAAVTVFSLVVFSLLSSVENDTRGLHEAKNLRVALRLAQEKMDELIVWHLTAPEGQNLATTGEWEEYPGYSWLIQQEEIDLRTQDEIDKGKDPYTVMKTTVTVRYPKADGGKGEVKLCAILRARESSR